MATASAGLHVLGGSAHSSHPAGGLLGRCGLGGLGLLLRRLVGAYLSLGLVFDLLGNYRQVHEVVHLGLGAHDVLLVNVGDLRECLVRFTLEVERLAVVSQLVVGMRYRLITRDYLKVFLPEQCQITVQAL